jgi:mono/diheme cytochrome c family protein
MRAPPALFVAVISLAVIGCGGGGSSKSSDGSGSAKSGAQVFASAGCKGCHTLKAAGANGQVGPNLDELKPDEATVEHQVTVGGGAMPSFKGTLSPAQIKAVAQYVSSVAGKS